MSALADCSLAIQADQYRDIDMLDKDGLFLTFIWMLGVRIDGITLVASNSLICCSCLELRF